MQILLRTIAIQCLVSVLAIALSLLFGKVFPSSVVEWASSTLLLHDTRTGVNFVFLVPGDTSNAPQISGVQITESPNGIHRMTLMGNATGLDIRITDADGRLLHALDSNDAVNISNVGWLDDEHILVMRVAFATSNFRLTRFDITTGEECEIGVYANSYIVLSPDRNWLLLSERATGFTEVISIWDERRYEISILASNFAWSGDGHYFASRTALQGEFDFQLLDTETGTVITQDMSPNRLAWSSNHQDLIIHDIWNVVLYRGMQRITQLRMDDSIASVGWSPDGLYAYIITTAPTELQLFLVDFEHETPIRLLTTIPQSAQANSVTWGYDSPVLSYVVNAPERNESLVYRIHIPDGTTDLLTRIPAQIRQVRYIETLENYWNTP